MCGKVERLQQISSNLHHGSSTTSSAAAANTTTSSSPYGRGFPNLYYSKEQCFAVNNIDYVLQVINPLVLELGMSDVLETLEAENGGLVADACKKTVKTMLRNAVENVENQILQVGQN